MPIYEAFSAAVDGYSVEFRLFLPDSAVDPSQYSRGGALQIRLLKVCRASNPQTNAVTGTVNTPVDIAAGGSQSFVVGLTPRAAFSPGQAAFRFACNGIPPAPTYPGLNTLLTSGSTSPVPDVVALAATTSNDGILHLAGSSGSSAFAVATVNVGVSGTITASASTGQTSLPLALSLCETNPLTGACLAAPSASVTTTIAANATPTFAIFAAASGAIDFMPQTNRILVQFAEASGAVRGLTSVAVSEQ